VALVLGALLVSLPLAELVVRVVAPQKLPSQEQIRGYVLNDMYVADEKAGFRPAPRFSGRIERAGVVTEFSTNSLGLRGGELGPKKGPRIAAFGDSFTWGWGCPQGQEWIHVAGREIEKLGGPPVETVNCGVNGYGTGTAVGLLEEIGPEIHPDVVLLGFSNDYTDNFADMLGTPGIYTVREGTSSTRSRMITSRRTGSRGRATSIAWSPARGRRSGSRCCIASPARAPSRYSRRTTMRAAPTSRRSRFCG
jgi:hypothetical protein